MLLCLKLLVSSHVLSTTLPRGCRSPILIPADPAPLSVPALTSVAKLHHMFVMLNMSHVFVVGGGGELIGVVTKKDLIELRL